MPIYEYQCTQCGHELELIQKISDAVITQCPACSEQTLRKCVSAPSFRLGGSGWYETDFKSGKKKNISRADKPEQKASSSCDSGSCK